MLTKLEQGIHDRSGWLRGCRCRTCHRALLNYSRDRDAAAAVRRGREPAVRIDPSRVRRHVGELRAGGWSVSAIARAAGVNRSTVERLVHGQLRRCSRITARLLFGVEGPPR